PYNAGMAAANAIEVCELVTHGMTSVHGALDGEFGFGATHFGAQKDPHQVVSDLGSVYKMCDVRYKFHACCHGTHAALEAFSKVRPKDLPRARVTVFVHPKWLDVCNIDAPQTGLQAKFSYKHVLALMALGYDTGQLDSFTDAICEAPEIATFRNQISVVAAPELTDSQARVEVDVDGARQQAFFDLHSPTDLDALRIRVEEKFKKLVPPQDVKALIDLSYPLARLATLDPIAERISAAKNKAFQSL
ncbi:MAG: MmgE/PrpD family protein, partial [Halocynthiibacter sp.]